MRFNQLPDSIRFINLYGIPYYIPWEEMLPGCSFFLKTTASAAVVRQTLKYAEKFFNIVLQPQARSEFGYYGVRVWRIA